MLHNFFSIVKNIICGIQNGKTFTYKRKKFVELVEGRKRRSGEGVSNREWGVELFNGVESREGRQVSSRLRMEEAYKNVYN